MRGEKKRKVGASLNEHIDLRQQIRGCRSRHIQFFLRRVCFLFKQCYQNHYKQTTWVLINSLHPSDLHKFVFQFRSRRGYFCMKSFFQIHWYGNLWYNNRRKLLYRTEIDIYEHVESILQLVSLYTIYVRELFYKITLMVNTGKNVCQRRVLNMFDLHWTIY